MTEEQKYLFDLQGFIVLEDVVPKSVIEACNEALDEFEEMSPEDYPPPLCLGTEKTEQELYISNILEGSPVFSPLIDILEVLDVVAEVTGGPWRLNHTYTIYRWGGGYTGLHMHGTPIIPKCQYHCRNGQMVSTLTKAVFPLLDCDVEDGCFAAVPGAHKSNFPRPWGRDPAETPVPRPDPRQGRRRHRLHRGPHPRLDGQRLGPSAPYPLLLLQHRIHAGLGAARACASATGSWTVSPRHSARSSS